jgi:DNA-binding CsgD family transcriptional regulator
MKSARREWALVASHFLHNIFIYFQFAFMVETVADPQKIGQIHVLGTVGMVLGAVLLPLLLPLGDLREGRRPSRYTLRLVIVAAFFLPQIIVRLLGEEAWQKSSFNYWFMALGNGLVSTLMFGCFFTLAGKHRAFWAALALSAGLFWYNLTLGPARELLPYMFASAGIALTAAGVLLLVFLAGLSRGLGMEGRKDTSAGKSRAVSQDEASCAAANAGRRGLLPCVFPILAALIIFWTNSFTDQLFLPTLNINSFPPGFNLTSLTLIVALPVFGLLARLRWRHFLKESIRLSSFLFLLSPSLLLLSHSQTLFLILHTLNITVMQMITVIFPCAIIDLYWQKRPGAHGYWAAWLLVILFYLINANALVLTGPFKALSLENGYAVVLLSLAAVAFYFLSQPLVLPKPNNTAGITVPAAAAANLADIFREHNLSERETEVALLLVQEGLSNEEMGNRLCISERTIKSHVYQIYQKFGVKKRAAFLAKALKK